MTASNTARGAASPAPALAELRDAALRYAAAKAGRKLGDWADHLNDFVASRGPTTRAVVEGLKATLSGSNPVWAAIKGAWSAAGPTLKLAMVLILILALLLAPVVLLVVVLGVLVAALVAGVRAAAR
jgi:hypothetical protein